MTAGATNAFVLVGGTIHDPANHRDGVVGDIHVVDGRIVADAGGASQRIDVRGLVVMPGGVDLHSHVAGPKVNAGRRIAPRLAQPARLRPAAVPTIHAKIGRAHV